MIQLTVWSLPSLAAILIAVYAARVVKRSGDVPGALAARWLCGCVGLWSLGQLLGSMSTVLEVKVLTSKLQYPGVVMLPVTWLVFAITYSRRLRTLDPRMLAAIAALPLVSLALAWTNELHGLVWREVTLNPMGGYVGMAIEYGPWFRVHFSYSYALVALATVMLVYVLSSWRRHRRALLTVIVAPLIVAGLNLLYLTPWNPFPFFDPTPLGFALGCLVLTRGVLQQSMLDISPTLHRQVVEQLPDGVLVIDADGMVIDINPAAESMLITVSGPNRSLSDVLADPRLRGLSGESGEGIEVALGPRTYDVKATRLNVAEETRPNSVLVFRDITRRLEAENELRKVKQEMERLAHTDSLTGLHNRRFFLERLEQEIERVRRHGHALSVMLLDLDHFKDVNDTHGHAVGDRVLEQVAAALEHCKRQGDVAARLGGEEFALLLPETAIDGALRLAERLRAGIAAETVTTSQSGTVGVTTSIGVATVSPTTPSGESMLRQADRALYRAKSEGRDSVSCATG